MSQGQSHQALSPPAPDCSRADRARPRPDQSLMLEGEEAFCRDLPALLKEHEGKWVAYRGTQRLGVADSSSALYKRCMEEGINPRELFIEWVNPGVAGGECSFAHPKDWQG